MNKLDKEKIAEQLENDILAHKELVDNLHGDYLDEDGYPTEEALELIEGWHFTDIEGWFKFINSLWHLKSWGWHEGTGKHDWDKDKEVYLYNISTAGWSGNESIIGAMQKNWMCWAISWVQSRRGGHYIFELKKYEDD
jgi:hypothetical protein